MLMAQEIEQSSTKSSFHSIARIADDLSNELTDNLSVVLIPISLIDAHPLSLSIYGEEPIDDLSIVIKATGKFIPIELRFKAEEERYEVISGHRRLRYAKSQEWESVPSIVKTLNKEEATIHFLVSNKTREVNNEQKLRAALFWEAIEKEHLEKERREKKKRKKGADSSTVRDKGAAYVGLSGRTLDAGRAVIAFLDSRPSDSKKVSNVRETLNKNIHKANRLIRFYEQQEENSVKKEEGQVCKIYGFGDKEIQRLSNKWCVVKQRREHSVVVDTWNEKDIVLMDRDLLPLELPTNTSSKKVSRLCDRLSEASLFFRDYGEDPHGAIMALLSNIGNRSDGPVLSETEEDLIRLLEVRILRQRLVQQITDAIGSKDIEQLKCLRTQYKINYTKACKLLSEDLAIALKELRDSSKKGV